MERRKAKVRYRRWRDDVHTHEKTGGMRLDSYGLMQYACAQNILGVLRQSVRSLAEQFDTTPRAIGLTIAQLIERPGLARWWPELETLWIIETLDEQSDGPKVDVHAARLLVTFPRRIQDAIRERYGDRVSLTVSDTLCDTPFDRGSAQESGAGIRTQEQDQDSPPSPPLGDERESPANDLPGEESPAMLAATSTPKRSGGRKKPRAAVDGEFAQAAYEAFSEARLELTKRAPREFTDTMRDELAKLVAACAPTIDDWRGAVRVRLAMDRRGEGYGSLTWASLTAPKNFERWLLESQKTGDQRHRPQGRAPVSSKPTTSGVVDLRELFGKRDAT